MRKECDELSRKSVSPVLAKNAGHYQMRIEPVTQNFMERNKKQTKQTKQTNKQKKKTVYRYMTGQEGTAVSKILYLKGCE